MTSSIQKLDDNFPIYLIKNFYKIDKGVKNKLISIVLDCKKRNSVHGNVGSFLVDKDYNNIFENLYDQYDQTCKKFFGSYTRVDNEKAIWSYSSNKHQHGLIPGIIHNHLRTSTINSVYYLNIPDSVTIEKGSISFFLNEKVN